MPSAFKHVPVLLAPSYCRSFHKYTLLECCTGITFVASCLTLAISDTKLTLANILDRKMLRLETHNQPFLPSAVHHLSEPVSDFCINYQEQVPSIKLCPEADNKQINWGWTRKLQ
uniref:Uncharacterized protein n=1 Tax=Kalanchoe fedtschenkoi TaxID=63787 RepID=A0A7N0RG08_KALFE